jgi:hypothetical protein
MKARPSKNKIVKMARMNLSFRATFF